MWVSKSEQYHNWIDYLGGSGVRTNVITPDKEEWSLLLRGSGTDSNETIMLGNINRGDINERCWTYNFLRRLIPGQKSGPNLYHSAEIMFPVSISDSKRVHPLKIRIDVDYNT